jgi:hypothetical protein
MKLTGHTFLTLAGECAGSRRSSIRARSRRAGGGVHWVTGRSCSRQQASGVITRRRRQMIPGGCQVLRSGT